MTGGGNAAASSSTTSRPLTDLLPWSLTERRTILIADCVENDGRFLLHTAACEILARQEQKQKRGRGRILWLATGPWTERMVATALKKLASSSGASSCCEAVQKFLRSLDEEEKKEQQDSGTSFASVHKEENRKIDQDYCSSATDRVKGSTLLTSSGALCIQSLTRQLATQMQQQQHHTNNDNHSPVDIELITKNLYRQVKHWLTTTDSDPNSNSATPSGEVRQWVILDDVSALAALVGERLSYGLVTSLAALSIRSGQFGLLLKCSLDMDYRQQQQQQASGLTAAQQIGATVTASSGSQWVGAGGATPPMTVDNMCWERSLVEIADGLVHVLPLTTGYSQAAHGRLYFMPGPTGQGWEEPKRQRSKAPSPKGLDVTSVPGTILNYFLTADNKITATRVQTTTNTTST